MENLFLFLATSFVFRFSARPKVAHQSIGDRGCSALLSGKRQKATATEGGDKLYFHEFKESQTTFGLICISLHQEYSLDEASAMLQNYMEKLHVPFTILHQTGIQPETDWNSQASCALVDYWQDGECVDWKVKGYTDGRSLAVLYVRNIGPVDVARQDLFLDSFYFGG